MKPKVPLLPETDLPKQLGRYFVTECLGVGGMASVYLAELCGPAGFRKKVALKLIATPQFDAEDHPAVEDISSEARVGGLLHHPNIVDVYELGDWQGHRYIAMEWVDGLTLSELVHRVGPPPAPVLLEIASAVALALETAHTLTLSDSSVGLFHRDIKPSNIMVTENGEVKLVDFGIATTSADSVPTASGGDLTVPGTPTYMAPEQLMGLPVDARTDLYALGLVLSAISTGEPPPKNYLLKRMLAGQSPEVAVLDATKHDELERITAGLGTLLTKTTHPKASQRFQTAAEWHEAIEALRDTTGFRPRLRTWLRERLRSSAEDPTEIFSFEGRDGAEISHSVFEENTLQLFPTNIGETSDEFVGRTEYLKTLRSTVLGKVRVVTILGMGGAGKTRLARQCGRELKRDFDGGVWFVDLTEATDQHSLLQMVSEVLDLPVPKQEQESHAAQVAECLNGMGKTLIILDNFEQIAELAASTVELWCQKSPETRFVVTSRIRLNIKGEYVLQLPPLEPDEAIELFYHLSLIHI